MTVVYWMAAVALLLLAVPGLVFYAAFLSTGEPVPQARARSCYRWCVVVVLGTFNIAVFKRVFEGIQALIR